MPKLENYLEGAPVNAHRRFLRSQLIERDMPVESVDAFLGHWFVGEEPWSVYSSFDVPSYIEDLKRKLYPLLEEVGLTARVEEFG